jgi:hypothetical protein
MGVINLGNLVSKLKNSLSGTFVKKTDKASKTKFGLVKIGNGIDVASGVISVSASGGMELLIPGDYTESGVTGSQYLRTATGKDLTQYKILLITMSGSTNGSCSTVTCDFSADPTKACMGYYLNDNGATAQIQYNLAKSSGSEVYDSIYISYGTTIGKWGNIYGIK